ncbi:neuroligin-4, X-linked-like [Macrobrachium nipponense]|uniref:neuroligin-4, X-linked-like n=1 Tax=Macrobrachium nipponense TaxID=159736 RepID=UPI0030C8C5FC
MGTNIGTKWVWVFGFWVILSLSSIPQVESDKLPKTPPVATKYGQLRGFYRNVSGYGLRVATYLGVPYATPPVGANRFSPTRTLSQWVGVHEATHFGPACPQKLPDISNETAALSYMSRGRLKTLRKFEPVLRRQSEDCLYLNLYVPDEDRYTTGYPVVVYVHGESYQWGSASLYDGSVLAALAKVIVVTINYRLGILGFFNPNVDPVGRATVANYGLMDQLAALHWVQENIVRFGGDPGQVTVMGHGTGAACLNFLVISPAAVGLFKRAILMSGSALSPWAVVQEPVYYAVQAARQLACEVPEDLYRHYESLLHCLRDRTIDQILQVELETPQFLSAIGPSVDGVTIRSEWKHQHMKMGQEGRTPVDLLLGFTATDVLALFSDTEIHNGFESDHRDRLLRTFVTNNYKYHLQEIVLAITAEYTDWARPVQHPVNIRDLTADALHDAILVSPMTVAANQLYTPTRQTYLYVLDYRPEEPDPERGPTVPMNELVYVFGASLGATGPLAIGMSYSKSEVSLAESVVTMWTNFIKTGNPNEAGRGETSWDVPKDKSRYRTQDWANYDPTHRRYLELGSRGRVRDHYRASRVALWSWLVPGLEKVGSRYGPESPFHRLPNYLQPDTFSGPTRPTNLSSNFLPPPTTPPPTTVQQSTLPPTTIHPTVMIIANTSSVAGLMEDPDAANMQRANFPYTTALSLTVAIGCSLLILNLLVFAAVYYRRDGNRNHAFNKQTHDGSSDSGNDVQLHPAMDPCKPISPSHYGTLRSSATLRSSLATSFEGDSQHEWPPDYSTSCQVGEDSVPCGPGSQCLQAMTGPGQKPHNGTAPTRRTLPRQNLPYNRVETQIPSGAYTHDDTPDMHV